MSERRWLEPPELPLEPPLEAVDWPLLEEGELSLDPVEYLVDELEPED